ncbi:hypothetical protein [Streptomyces viridochromogenes]|nr:hypothetical protein [Streptomyces viridochromogenes]
MSGGPKCVSAERVEQVVKARMGRQAKIEEVRPRTRADPPGAVVQDP